MPTIKPSYFVIALLYPLCLACQEAGAPSETESGPGDPSGTPTAPGAPTTSPNTPTTTTDEGARSSADAPLTTGGEAVDGFDEVESRHAGQLLAKFDYF